MNLTSSLPQLDMNLVAASERLTFILGVTIPMGFICVCFGLCCLGSARCFCECVGWCCVSARKCVEYPSRELPVWDIMGSPGGGLCMVVVGCFVEIEQAG
jgi:hypothetical protein